MDAGLDPGTGRGALSLRRRVPLGKPFPLDSWYPPTPPPREPWEDGTELFGRPFPEQTTEGEGAAMWPLWRPDLGREAWGGRSENLLNKAKTLFKGVVMLA